MNLATLPADTLKMDKNNVYYCKLAIQRKEELARQKNLVDPRIIQRELSKINKGKELRLIKERKNII
jgi:hypothetical protein